MRAIAAALMLAACAAPPPPAPRNPTLEVPVWGTPDPRYIPPARSPAELAGRVAAEDAAGARRIAAETEERRRAEFCESLADTIWQRTATMSERLAAPAVGSARRSADYADCLESFRRVDRYVAPR